MSRRIHTVDDTFFDKIDTEEKAYWLGFILADGYVFTLPDRRPRGVSANLAKRDVGHLRKMRRSLRSSNRIESFHKGRNRCIRIGSPKIAAALGNLGVTPAKSLTVKPCKVAPDLERHYWRGVFDGDGCLHKRSDRRRWSIDVSGTRAVTEGFRKFVLSRGIETAAKSQKAGNIWRFAVCGVALPRQISKLLYDGASVYLDRKYEDYLKLAAAKDIQRRTGKRGWLEAKMAYEKLGTWKAAAAEVGIPWRTVYRLKKKWEAA